MNKTSRTLLPLLAILAAPLLQAAEPCAGFKWEVSPEVTLFKAAASAFDAGVRASDAPRIEAGRLYDARLSAQSAVTLAAPPTKKMLEDGAHAGLFRLRVAEAGLYRVSVDAGFWVDVLNGDKPLAAADFSGDTRCKAPRKIVLYELPAEAELTLQFSAADSDRTRFAITKVAATAP